MTFAATHLPDPTRARWFHWVLLGLLLGAGALLRFRQIDRQSLWIDEYWTLYQSTGRGNALFDLPQGIILESPPSFGFQGAPGAVHIWTGLGLGRHPPLYFLALRGWIGLFGSGDLATRGLSAVFGLAGAAALFQLMRRCAGAGAGVIAAGIMAFAPMQIDFSQMARAYTMLPFLGIVMCCAAVAIERGGLSRGKLVVLGASAGAMILTHYLSLTEIGAIGVYALIRLRGRTRTKTILAIAAGLAVAGIIWGPFCWQNRGEFSLEAYPKFGMITGSRVPFLARATVTMPARLFVDSGGEWSWITALPLAVLVYVAPLILVRRYPEMLLWWLWIVATLLMLAAIDALRGTVTLAIDRYVFVASPAVFAILATPLPSRVGKLVPPAALLAAVIFGIDRAAIGPRPTQDWRTLAKLLDRSASAGDVVALTGHYEFEPEFDYFVLEHYIGRWDRPVVLLMNRPSDSVLRQLAASKHVWVVGGDPIGDTAEFFPGWKIGAERGAGIGDLIWLIQPPDKFVHKAAATLRIAPSQSPRAG